MQISYMTIDDYDSVYKLWVSCKGMGLNNIDDSKVGIEKFLLRNPTTCLTASENGEIIGVIMAGNDGRRGYIYHTAVSPVHRYKGIGTVLVRKALEELSKLGIIKVALVVFGRNTEGNAFREKQGFKVRDDLVYRNIALTDIKRIDT